MLAIVSARAEIVRLRGMVMDHHLVKDPALLEEHVVLWCDLMRTRIRARPGVNTPPPRPPEWVFQ